MLPEFIHIGPQKAATTWLYRALAEHPEVRCAESHSTHYFDIHYSKGWEWYETHFPVSTPGQSVTIEFTPTYLRSPWAARRTARDLPDARYIVCLRHPIERAWSHWWHERKKGAITHPFSDVLRNYDLFSSWVEPGLYAEHLERWFRKHPREHFLIQRYELLTEDPAAFYREVVAFVGVNSDFEPTMLRRRINAAGARRGLPQLTSRGARALESLGVSARRLRPLRGRPEYEKGIDHDLFVELLELVEPEIERLETLLTIELPEWRAYPGVTA